MENPYTLAHNLPFIKWIWATNKRGVMFRTLFALAIIVCSFIYTALEDSKWALVIFSILWWGLNFLGWIMLWKRNRMLYYNWEETYNSGGDND